METHGADAKERTATGAQRITEFGMAGHRNGCHQSLIDLFKMGHAIPKSQGCAIPISYRFFVADVY